MRFLGREEDVSPSFSPSLSALPIEPTTLCELSFLPLTRHPIEAEALSPFNLPRTRDKILTFTLNCYRAATFDPSVGMKVTQRAAIANAPLPVEGNGSFSNLQLAAFVLFVPYFLTKFIPYFSFKTSYFFLLILTGLPTTICYWLFMSRLNFRVRENGILPGKDIEEYIVIKDESLKEKYNGQNKIPMQVFHDAYFEGKIDIKGSVSSSLPP